MDVREMGFVIIVITLWSQRQLFRGRPKTTFIDVLKENTGLEEPAEMQLLMQNQVLWRQFNVSGRPDTDWLNSEKYI